MGNNSTKESDSSKRYEHAKIQPHNPKAETFIASSEVRSVIIHQDSGPLVIRYVPKKPSVERPDTN